MARIPKKTKDPDEVLDYTVDFAARLNGDTITSHQAFTADASGDPVSVALTVDSSDHDDETVTVWLSGGVLGETYRVCTRVVTVAGRTMDQSFSVTMVVR